jgi:hypothetical protein
VREGGKKSIGLSLVTTGRGPSEDGACLQTSLERPLLRGAEIQTEALPGAAWWPQVAHGPEGAILITIP